MALTIDNRINLYRSINLSDISVTLDPDRSRDGNHRSVRCVAVDIRLLHSTMYSEYAEFFFFASGTSVCLPSNLFIEHGRFIS